MYDLTRFVAAIAFIWLVGYLALSVYEARRDYKEDRYARGNWALRLWWRWFSSTPAARKRRWETLAELGILSLIIGLPTLWLTGAFFAWQAGKLSEYWEWTKKIAELVQKFLELLAAYRK